MSEDGLFVRLLFVAPFSITVNDEYISHKTKSSRIRKQPNKMKFPKLVLALLSICGVCASNDNDSALKLHSMPPNPLPYQVTYEDGSQSPLLRLKMKGDELSSEVYEETLDGFTVGPSTDLGGKYTYRDVNMETGDLIDTGLVAGEADPYSMKVHKNAAVESSLMKAKNIAHPLFKEENGSRKLRGPNVPEKDQRSHRRTVITSGNMANLVLPIRFSDHTSRTLPSRAELNTLMNNDGPDPLAPTGSVRDVFLESSHNTLTIDSTVVDWITIDYTEAQCAGGSSGLWTGIHTCLANALTKLDQSGFDFSALDVDGGKLDYFLI